MPPTRFTRPLAAAAALGSGAGNARGFPNKRVLLTGDSAVLAHENGRWCLLGALRLLVRMCARLDVAVPSNAALADELALLSAHIADEGQISLVPTGHRAEYDAVLSVGVTAMPGEPRTVVNSNGWLARVSSGATSLTHEVAQTNPVGAFAAACLGVGEVFKRIAEVRPGRGPLQDATTFSLMTLGTGEADPGPRLPACIDVSLLLGGAGTIGNAIALMLSQLPCRGEITVVDRQVFARENLGTCVLIGPRDLGQPKADVLAAQFGDAITSIPRTCNVEDIRNSLGTDLPVPAVVITAFDSVAARHQAQDIWPDLVIDGGIDNFMVQVGRHPWGADVACLRCVLREATGPPSELVQARATGLDVARLRDQDSRVTEADVAAAPADRRAFLRTNVGRPVCSVVAEGVLEHISDLPPAEHATLTVPFVAGLSGAMVVADVVKHACGWATLLEPRFQFDALRGPGAGIWFPEARRPGCMCVTRASTIERFRQIRADGPGAHGAP